MKEKIREMRDYRESGGGCIWPLNKAMRRIIFIIQIFMLGNSIGLPWRPPPSMVARFSRIPYLSLHPFLRLFHSCV